MGATRNPPFYTEELLAGFTTQKNHTIIVLQPDVTIKYKMVRVVGPPHHA